MAVFNNKICKTEFILIRNNDCKNLEKFSLVIRYLHQTNKMLKIINH